MSFFVKMTDIDRLATSGEFQEAGELLQLDHPSRVFLDLQQEDIRSFRRENADLIIEAADGSKLRIANFYQTNGDCQLYLKGDDGGLMLAVLSQVDDSGSLFSQYVALTEASPFEAAGETSSASSSSGSATGGSWFSDNWGLVGLGALALAGAGAAVAGLGGGGGSDGDNTPPAAPVIPSVSGNVGEAFQAGATTVVDDTQPTFSGTGTTGDTIKLYEGTTLVGQANVANGSWSITPATALAAGAHNLTLTATDASGNQSASTAFNLTVDNDGTLNGGSGADLLIGGAGNNTLNGGDGDDKLIDGIGSDTFNGGAGNDQMVISGTGFASIDGGDSALDLDILMLDNSISLDTNAMTGTIANIERIDMTTDTTANTLTLTSGAVTAMTDIDNELQIVGGSNDTLNASGANNKVTGALVENGVTYDQYTFGTATLLVDQDIVIHTA